jgi:hypothetical protein
MDAGALDTLGSLCGFVVLGSFLVLGVSWLRRVVEGG